MLEHLRHSFVFEQLRSMLSEEDTEAAVRLFLSREVYAAVMGAREYIQKYAATFPEDAIEAIRKNHPYKAPPGMVVTFLPYTYFMGLARVLEPLCALTDDDMLLHYALQLQYNLEAFAQGGDSSKAGATKRYEVATQHVALARWARYGMPSVRLTPVQACALALSDMTEEQLREVRPPWPVFMLHAGDAFVADEACARFTLAVRWNTRAVAARDGQWDTATHMDDGGVIWRFHQSADYLFGGHGNNLLFEDSGGLSRQEERMSVVVGRTILNLCEVLSNKEGVLCKAKDRKKGDKKRPVTGMGLMRDLALPVKVDMRQHVRDYLSSTIERVYKVRWVVRGHWRKQVCGVGRSERKRRWIEPYWKGPEKGTRIVREHQVTDAVVGLPEEKEECQTTVATTPKVGAETPVVEQR
jgi:hypothetical protein